MVKNNIKSLLIHMVISLLSLLIYIAFHASAVMWASEEAASKHHVSMLIVSSAIIIVTLFLYYSSSKKFLKNQIGSFKNIMSFSIISLIGIALWLTAFCIDLTGGTKILLNSELWQLYSTYYGYCLYLVDEMAVGNPYIMLVFGILPTITMYLGLKNSNDK